MDAFVIRTWPFREHDRMVVLYGLQTGKLTAVARGSLRSSSKQSIALDEGNMIRYEPVAGRGEFPVITGAQSQRCWGYVKSSPLAWAVAGYFLQALDAVVYDSQPDQRIWQTLAGIFDDLESGQNPLAVLREGQSRFLDALGYGRHTRSRAELDGAFEHIAQRRLAALDLVYELAR